MKSHNYGPLGATVAMIAGPGEGARNMIQANPVSGMVSGGIVLPDTFRSAMWTGAGLVAGAAVLTGAWRLLRAAGLIAGRRRR